MMASSSSSLYAPRSAGLSNGTSVNLYGPHSARAAAATGKPTGSDYNAKRTGYKRDSEVAATTDGADAASSLLAQPLAKKKKITYALPNQNMDEGHFYVVLGEDVDPNTGRFKILSLLGEGTFGKVIEAWDRKRKEYCAVKIVRNVAKYTRDATIEIKYMERVRNADPEDKYPLMKIQRHFRNESGHICIVMPKHGTCMLDHIQRNGRLSNRQLAEVAFQTGIALDYFHSYLKFIHTDLKPENILLESNDSANPENAMKVRICDMGGCCDERHSPHAIVSTRHYRSPEVVLGMGWMFSTDMWSMGCILFELASGRLLYDTHDNLEHLHMMERSLGELPKEWVNRTMETMKAMYAPGTANLAPLRDTKMIARVRRVQPLRESVTDPLLQSLILSLLDTDPRRRITARQMASHPFVLQHYPEAAQHPLFPPKLANMPPTPTW